MKLLTSGSSLFVTIYANGCLQDLLNQLARETPACPPFKVHDRWRTVIRCRCDVCGWPIASEGCVPGNCSQKDRYLFRHTPTGIMGLPGKGPVTMSLYAVLVSFSAASGLQPEIAAVNLLDEHWNSEYHVVTVDVTGARIWPPFLVVAETPSEVGPAFAEGTSFTAYTNDLGDESIPDGQFVTITVLPDAATLSFTAKILKGEVSL